MPLKALEIVYRVNGDAFEGLTDRNWHIRKLVSEGVSVSWEGVQKKGEGRECELTKNVFLHSDLLKLCPKKNKTSMISYLTQLCFTIRKLALRGNRVLI